MDPTKGAHHDHERTAQEVAEEIERAIVPKSSINTTRAKRIAKILRDWKLAPDEITIDVARAAARMYDHLDGIVDEAFLRDALHSCLPDAVERGGCDHDGWHVTREDLQQFLEEYNFEDDHKKWEEMAIEYLIIEITNHNIKCLDELREEPEYEVGDVLKKKDQDDNFYADYFFVKEIRKFEGGYCYYVALSKEGHAERDVSEVEGPYEKIGTFRPSDKALERVPNRKGGVNGEILIYEDTEKSAALWIGGEGEKNVYEACLEPVTGVSIDCFKDSWARSGIVIDFHWEEK